MLLQTNSYIVPKDRRAEHARLLRRFRQILTRLGCEQFEVYEQLGANWSTAEQTGRFVQIMRFKDRRHQRQVHAAEQSDRAAQQLIEEFCALINLSYQQQQGLLAVGYYQSVVDSPTKRPAAEAPDPFAGAAPAGAGFGMAGAAAAGVSMAGPLGMGGRSTVVPVDLDADDEPEVADAAAADEPGLADEPVVAEVAEAHDTYTLVAGPETAADAGPQTATISAEVPPELRDEPAAVEAEQPEAVADDAFDPDALLAEVPPVPAAEPAAAEPVAGELLVADEGLLEVQEWTPGVGHSADAGADAGADVAAAHDPLTPEVEAELTADHVATEDGLSGLPPEVVDELNFDDVSAGLEFQPDAEPAAEVPAAHATQVEAPAVAEPPAAAAHSEEALPVEELTALDEWPTEELAPAAELSPLEEAAPVAEVPAVEESASVDEFAPVEGLSALEELPPAAEAAPVEDLAPVEEAAAVEEAAPVAEPLAIVEADAEEPDLPDELSLAPLAADVLPTMSEEGVAAGELQPVEAATADEGVVADAGGEAISLDDFLLDEAPASAVAEPAAEPVAALSAEEPLPVEEAPLAEVSATDGFTADVSAADDGGASADAWAAPATAAAEATDLPVAHEPAFEVSGEEPAYLAAEPQSESESAAAAGEPVSIDGSVPTDDLAAAEAPQPVEAFEPVAGLGEPVAEMGEPVAADAATLGSESESGPAEMSTAAGDAAFANDATAEGESADFAVAPLEPVAEASPAEAGADEPELWEGLLEQAEPTAATPAQPTDADVAEGAAIGEVAPDGAAVAAATESAADADGSEMAVPEGAALVEGLASHLVAEEGEIDIVFESVPDGYAEYEEDVTAEAGEDEIEAALSEALGEGDALEASGHRGG